MRSKSLNNSQRNGVTHISGAINSNYRTVSRAATYNAARSITITRAIYLAQDRPAEVPTLTLLEHGDNIAANTLEREEERVDRPRFTTRFADPASLIFPTEFIVFIASYLAI
jgi:hypothetical protein